MTNSLVNTPSVLEQRASAGAGGTGFLPHTYLRWKPGTHFCCLSDSLFIAESRCICYLAQSHKMKKENKGPVCDMVSSYKEADDRYSVGMCFQA